LKKDLKIEKGERLSFDDFILVLADVYWVIYLSLNLGTNSLIPFFT
jgi:hypothetical protein